MDRVAVPEVAPEAAPAARVAALVAAQVAAAARDSRLYLLLCGPQFPPVSVELRGAPFR